MFTSKLSGFNVTSWTQFRSSRLRSAGSPCWNTFAVNRRYFITVSTSSCGGIPVATEATVISSRSRTSSDQRPFAPLASPRDAGARRETSRLGGSHGGVVENQDLRAQLHQRIDGPRL